MNDYMIALMDCFRLETEDHSSYRARAKAMEVTYYDANRFIFAEF